MGERAERVCQIFTETGDVSISCLFECQRKETCPMRVPDVFDYHDAEEEGFERRPSTVKCKRCDSTDVRWRQQGGKWVLFSLQPGVIHKCPPISAKDDFR